MNMLFNTPQEAIAACEAENERTWQDYLKLNNSDPSKAPEACEAAKAVFRAGYIAGARFVSGVIVQKMVAHSKNHIIEPDQQ